MHEEDIPLRSATASGFNLADAGTLAAYEVTLNAIPTKGNIMADKIRTLGPGSLVIGSDADQYRLDVDCTSVELAPDNSGAEHLSRRT